MIKARIYNNKGFNCYVVDGEFGFTRLTDYRKKNSGLIHCCEGEVTINDDFILKLFLYMKTSKIYVETIDVYSEHMCINDNQIKVSNYDYSFELEYFYSKGSYAS